jgi:hypothetical protein
MITSLFSLFKLVNTLIFVLLACLHVYWAWGGLGKSPSQGMSQVVPEIDGKPAFQPGFVATMAVAIGLLAFAFVSIWAIRPIYKGTSPVVASPGWCVYGNLAIAVIFLLRFVGDFNYVGLFKKVTHTRFARYDSRFYTPLCLLISLIAFYIYLQIKY